MTSIIKKPHESYWLATTPRTHYSALKKPLSFDVAIIGGGITGLTTAFLLKQAGKSVAVIDSHSIASGESGHTTAHLTELIDTRYYDVIAKFGKEKAKEVAAASHESIKKIKEIIEHLSISCDFKQIPGFLYTERKSDRSELKRELEALHQIGVHAKWENEAPLPFRTWGAIHLPNQASFHPRKYLLAIAEAIHGNGSHVFENTQAFEMIDGDPCQITCKAGRIIARDLIVTTHSPSANKVLLHTKLAAYRTYAVAGTLKHTPRLDALYWDTQDPYHYIRNQDSVWIIGGEDHKTGMKTDANSSFINLKEYVQSRFGWQELQYRWSGQVLEPIDGLPYIGLNPLSEHLYVATGFSGTGMTFGTVAAILLSDLILNRVNSWAELFNPSRIKPLSTLRTYITENKDFPLCFIKDRLMPSDVESLGEVHRGEGKTIRFNGKKIAVYRDLEDNIHGLEPECTHLGCHVRWNNAEASWDCPCHGSRFDVEGNVINGPATQNLNQVSLHSKKHQQKKRAA
jgi:glycine/D-amino acid oxidase-like deaminating enzyme/nitrite reductase/ring-hydroxylating ferredoxin subunit